MKWIFQRAFEKDKSHFCKYYWSIIKEKEILFSTFASDDPLNPGIQRVYI